MKILLQAEIKDTSMSSVQKQIEDIQKKAKPIKVYIDTSGATKNMSQISRAIDDASKLERDWGKAIRMRGDEAHSAALKINKAMESEKKTTEALKEQIELFKRRQEIQAKNIETKYKDTYNTEALAKFRTELQTLDATNPRVQSQMKSMAVSLREIGTEARNGQVGVQSLGQSVMGAVQQFAMFAGVSLSVAGAVRSVKGGINTIVELDTAMVELKKVTDETDATYNQFVNTAFSLGKELSRTGQEAINATSSFARMGFSLTESTGLAREALLMLNVADGVDNLDDATSTIIAALKGFNIASEDSVEMARKINDSYNEVSNNFAINAGDIANGVKRSSAVLHQAGVSMDQTIGMLTGSYEVLQNMEKASSGIMVISQRLRGIGTDGEAIEGLAPKLGAAFDDIGIKLVGTNNELRSTYDILGDLAEIFPRLSSQQAAYISELTSGKRQSSVLQGLMSNWETVVNATETSMDSMGSSILENEKYIDSISGKIENFKSNVMSFWNTAINSEVVKDAIDFGASFVGMLERVVGSFDGLQSVLGIIIPLIGIKLVFAFRSAYMEMVKLGAISGAKMLMSPSSISAVIKGMLGFTTVTQGATVAVGGLTLATGVLTLGLGAIAYAFMKSAQKAKEAKEAMANALDNSETLNTEINDLDRLAKKQAELSKIENKSAEQKEELIKVQRELAQLYPELATGIDAEGSKIAENTKMTKELTEQKKKLLEQELLVLSSRANENLPRLRKELEEMQVEAEDIQRKLASGNVNGSVTYYDEYGQAIEIVIDKTSEYQDRLLELVTAQQSHHSEIQNNESALDSYNKIVAEGVEKQKWAKAEELESQALRSKTKSQIEGISKELKRLGFNSSDTAKIVNGNLAEVKENHELLDIAMIENLMTVKELDEASQIASINMLNKSRDLTVGYINDTKKRIEAMRAEAKAILALSGTSLVKKAPDKLPMPKFGDSIIDTMGGMASYELGQANKELANLESSLAKIDAALSNVSGIKSSGIVGGTSANGKTKKGTKKKDEYSAEADRYEKINLELDRNNTLLQLNKIHQEQAGNDLSKKIPLMEKEIELNKQRQALQHKLNTQQREERANLEKSLSKQGFTFSGEGDTRTITNLEKIEGKSKEVEEQFNRYITLQKTEIPKASQEWANLQNAIENVRLNKLISEFGLIDQKMKLLDDSISDLDYRLALLDDSELDKKSSLIADKIAVLNKVVNQATHELINMGENGFKEGSKLSDEFNKKQEELIGTMRKANIEIKKLQQEIISNNKGIADQVIASIKKGYQEMLKLEKALVQDKIKLADDEHKEKIRLLDDWLKHHNDIVDKMLADLDKLYATEDYEGQLDNLKEERSVAERTLQAALGLSDDAVDKDSRVKQAREDLDILDKKIQDTMKQRARSLRKEELQETKKQNETIVNDKKQLENDKVESAKNAADREIEVIEEKYDRLINNDRMYEEIREEIMKGTYTRAGSHINGILGALESYNYSTVKDMKQSWQELENVINEVAKAKESFAGIKNPNIPTSSSSFSSGNANYGNSGVEEYKGQSKSVEWRLKNESGYAQDQIKRTEEIIKNRKDAGMDISTQQRFLEKLYKLPKFHDGGIVGGGSDKLTELVHKLFNTKPNEAIVKSLVGELQIPPQNIAKNFIPNIKSISQGVSAKNEIGRVVYNIDMVVEGVNGNKNGGKMVFEQLIGEIRKKGGVL